METGLCSDRGLSAQSNHGRYGKAGGGHWTTLNVLMVMS